MARRDLHHYPDEYYYPEALKSGVLTSAEMRKEYSYLRSIANKRLEHFKGSEFEHHQTYLINRNRFVPLSQIKDERELIHRLYEVKKFTTARTSSVTGLRDIQRQALETARERGYTFLNKSNIQAFGHFMEEARAKGYAKIYGSERIAELFGTATKKGINPEEIMVQFHFWMENQAELEELPKYRNANMRTSVYYADALKKMREKR